MAIHNQPARRVLGKFADFLLNCAVVAFIGSIFSTKFLFLSLIIALCCFSFGLGIHYLLGVK